MTLDQLTGALRPVPSIDDVLDAHGARKVLAAAIAALLRGKHRKTRPPDRGLRLPDVGPHLRRDLGLPEPVERLFPRL